MAKKSKKLQALLLAGALSLSVVVGGTMQLKHEINSSASNSVVQTKQVGTTKSNLNMRDKSNSKGKLIATLKKGTKVDVIKKESNGWYKVNYNGKNGYVSGQYLTITTVNIGGTTTQKPVTPKPEAPALLSFNTFASKLPSMGFDRNGVYWEGGNKMGVVYANGSEATFSLRQNSPAFNNTVKNCLNMLLPTGGNKVYDVVSKSFSNQTLKLDGRTVTIEQTGVGVGIKIYNN